MRCESVKKTMKNNYFFKTILLSAFLIFLGNSVNAQCDYTDDFSTLTRPAFWFVESVTSPAGWEGTWVDPYKYEGTTYMCLMPVSTGVETGILKSPNFANGCKLLDFKWETNGYSGAVSLKVELKQGDLTVWSDEINASNAVEFEIHQASYNNLNITGEVKLVISNLTTGHSGEYAGIDVWDFCLTNYTTTGIAQSNYTDNITVYPNPFTDYIVINSTNNEELTIYDISGTLIYQAELKAGSNHINTFGLGTGIYVLKCGKNAMKIVK